ncbi:hypothetical protein GCM10007423_39480 [Dyadobacter endophyticus]|uniref:Uncharacterized protein n=1 Tax=Dyadobacter endophyticus TaxID=1749036 RepID=A0ABQ1Z0A9_9BACT|nr:hypothetical protein [Dyadobacter endophyticus]GGH42678.1 hypothetical protein GCM10007423_39480 [Dyadobacter endophyticus]
MKFIPRSNCPTPYLVAIDPDLNKSGLAAWSTKDREWIIAKTVSIENVLSELSELPPTETTVYVEAGWLIKKANLRGGNYRAAQAKARNVGENHGAGKLICKLLKAAGYTVTEFKPLKKGAFKTLAGAWSDTGRRYVEKESGLSHRMNDDVRDAIYTVLHFR